MPVDCNQNIDPLKIIREGTSQDQRFFPALDPAYAPVDERKPEHAMVFAAAYSAFLKYYNSSNTEEGDWKIFFSEDVSFQLAIIAVQDVDIYKTNINTYFDFLNNHENQSKTAELKNNLGYLFSTLATLARQLDLMQESLPDEISLKGTLQNLIQGQLATSFKRLIAYYKGDLLLPASDRLIADIHPGITILNGDTDTFSNIFSIGLTSNWLVNSDNWNDYVTAITADAAVYGNAAGIVFDRINHISTHSLFTSIFDQFLKVYSRIISDAKLSFQTTIEACDSHQPHYALFIAFLRLMEHARSEANTLTAAHLDFYYREVLALKEKAAEPANAHLLVELAKNAVPYEIIEGELFKAGKDDLGNDAFFSNDRAFVANQSKVAALKTVYRHVTESVGTGADADKQNGRLYASPISNSDDGEGSALTSGDQSWHPFFNKIYSDGALSEIKMPQAEVGFAIASHYLWMAEGDRTITIDFTISGSLTDFSSDQKDDIECLFSGEKSWIEATISSFTMPSSNILRLVVGLTGADEAVTPYISDTHGYDFSTDLPLLLVKLRHQDSVTYLYSLLEDVAIEKIDLNVAVTGLRSLAVSNDFGPVDTSKPFQPFGASPIAGNSLIIGSKEIFQKNLNSISFKVTWLAAPDPYPSSPAVTNTVEILFLQSGKWESSEFVSELTGSKSFDVITGSGMSAAVSETSKLSIRLENLGIVGIDEPNIQANEFYSTASKFGFAKLKLTHDFGQGEYLTALLSYVRKDTADDPGSPPVGPFISALSMDYNASQTIILNSSVGEDFEEKNASFFHVAPFGQAEQHRWLKMEAEVTDLTVYLLPQFDFQRDNSKNESEAEFYIGITGLVPPQNLALLFQVADGTADPLSEKPDPHIHWSYLRENEWIPFEENEVADQTDELLNSGIITFAMPLEASNMNTILPSGMHWLRAAVSSESDTVCSLIMVAAQALEATFIDKGNDPSFPAKILEAGTITKLNSPNAAVKKITQPFSTFGGRGMELPAEFNTRISERLRHKDRSIALWDYERLLLEAFPEIFRAKCLNHTQYETNEDGTGIYKELAPGHVTIVTIPNLQSRNLRDPLHPYTSLGVLEEIDSFLRKKISCFVKLHVKNPQFEEVRVNFKVRFYDGFDETYYVLKLQEDITRFLSPWAFPGGGSPSFGGKVYKSVLINFIEEQPYVDYVSDFQLFQDINGVKGTTDKTEIEGSMAVSVLVSALAIKHLITVIEPAEAAAISEKCSCEK